LYRVPNNTEYLRISSSRGQMVCYVEESQYDDFYI